MVILMQCAWFLSVKFGSDGHNPDPPMICSRQAHGDQDGVQALENTDVHRRREVLARQANTTFLPSSSLKLSCSRKPGSQKR